jgi:hypothetical protein
VPLVLGNADMDHSLRALELGPRLEQIKRCVEFRRARGVAGRLVMAPPQPGSNRLLWIGQVKVLSILAPQTGAWRTRRRALGC